MLLIFASVVAASQLILDRFTTANEEVFKCSYRENEVVIDGTRMHLEGTTASISGLSADRYLLCFREGKLIFPLNPVDQQIEHSLEVYEGDKFYWVYDPQGALHARVFHRISVSEEEFETGYGFQVVAKKDSNLATRAHSYFRSLDWFFHRYRALIILMFAIVAIIPIIVIVVTSIPHKTTTPPAPPLDLCLDPQLIPCRTLTFRYNSSDLRLTSFRMDVDRNCNESFNWTENAERAYECLSDFFHLDPAEWIFSYSTGPIYRSISGSTPKVWCPYPPPQ